MNFYKYMLNNNYMCHIKCAFKTIMPDGTDGLVDSVRQLLADYTVNNRDTLRNLLQAF